MDDTVEIRFPLTISTNLNTKVKCKENSTLESINGSTHHCTELGHGQSGQILIQIKDDTNTMKNCSIKYMTSMIKEKDTY